MLRFLGSGAAVLLLTFWIKNSSSFFGLDLFVVVVTPYARALHLLNLESQGPISLMLFGVFRPRFLAAFELALFLTSPLTLYNLSGWLSRSGEEQARRRVACFAISCALFFGACLTGYFLAIPWTLFGLGRGLGWNIAKLGWTPYLGISGVLTIGLACLAEVPLIWFFRRNGSDAQSSL